MTAEAVDPALVELIRGRVATTRRHIASLTDRDVRIVCVTKGHPAAVAHAALAAGVADLGENYAQELIAKVSELAGLDLSPRWNFIGRLQSNKVRALAGIVDTWQSVDRASVATEIARRCPGADTFVQVDLAEIEGRGGCPVAEAPALVERCRDLGLVVSGLMGVGPPGPPEASRSGFRRLSHLADSLGLVERSMGMSNDYTVAVEEGSTMIRLGTALVGPRPRPAPTAR